METIKKGEFVELKYTGYSNGSPFDSNVEEDLKKLNPKAKTHKLIVIIGQEMVVPGLDKALEGKEIEKDYEIKLSAEEGFGERRRELVKTIPLKIFTEQKISPYPGLVLNMDNMLARIITVSGARVITDFNNPLSGKEVVYKFKVVRKVSDEKEKVECVLGLLLKFVPDYEIKENKVVVKGPKILEKYVEMMKEKFKELAGKELGFEEVKKEEKKEDTAGAKGSTKAEDSEITDAEEEVEAKNNKEK